MRKLLILLCLVGGCTTSSPPILKPVEVPAAQLPPIPAALTREEPNYLQKLEIFFAPKPPAPTAPSSN